jgi:hypothetical protein
VGKQDKKPAGEVSNALQKREYLLTIMDYRMTKITNEHKATMGETGAGITREEEIDMSQENVFTTKWGTYMRSNED